MDFSYLEGARFKIAECCNCGFIYQEQVGNDVIMFKVYEEWADIQRNFELNQLSHTPDYVVNHAKEIYHILSCYCTKPAHEYKVLDFGGGWSQWSRMAIAFGLDVYSHELSPTKKQFAEKFGIKVLTWEQISEHTFDFINTEQVFEHLTNPVDTIEYLKNCMHADSILKISVPNALGLKEYLQNEINWETLSDNDVFNSIAPLQHINAFTRGTLEFFVNHSGFKILSPLKYPYVMVNKNEATLSEVIQLSKKIIRKKMGKSEFIPDYSTYVLLKKNKS